MLPVAESALNCTEGIQWISTVFSECVDTRIKLVGFAIGFISLLLWFIPLIPQMHQNYKRKQCEGLSVMFILLWLVGDISNTAGTVLTSQTAIQKIIGVFYILQDLVLLGQYVYYTYIYKRGEQARAMAQTGATFLSAALLTLTVFFFVATHDIDTSFTGSGTLGYGLGTFAALSYLSGRIPQILKNYRRQSCEGLSLVMLYIIVPANITYGVSVLLGSEGEGCFLRHFPWLVGSIGCCGFDIFMIYQCYRYKGNDEGFQAINEPDVNNEDRPRPAVIVAADIEYGFGNPFYGLQQEAAAEDNMEVYGEDLPPLPRVGMDADGIPFFVEDDAGAAPKEDDR